MAIDPDNFDSVKTLRIFAGYSQSRAAELAGVSIRTWRRYEREGAPTVVIRWLRYECGIVPGWPNGWRVTKKGVHVPGLNLINFGMIEGAAWAIQQLNQESEALRERVKQSREAQEAADEAMQTPGANVVPIKRSG